MISLTARKRLIVSIVILSAILTFMYIYRSHDRANINTRHVDSESHDAGRWELDQEMAERRLKILEEMDAENSEMDVENSKNDTSRRKKKIVD